MKTQPETEARNGACGPLALVSQKSTKLPNLNPKLTISYTYTRNGACGPLVAQKSKVVSKVAQKQLNSLT